MATQEEVEELVRDVLKWIPPDQQNSPDITLLVFKMIEAKRALLGAHYRQLGGGKGSSLNAQIGAVVKLLLGRENDVEQQVSDDDCTLIESYTRFTATIGMVDPIRSMR
jgi:hypothetical protein